jgi:hypothetical protein
MNSKELLSDQIANVSDAFSRDDHHDALGTYQNV